MSEQKKMAAERAAFEAWWNDDSDERRRVMRSYTAKHWAEEIWQARASLPVGVPSEHFNNCIDARAYIADLFKTRMRRHDFTAYINERLAGDFAFALANWLVDASSPAAPTVKAEQVQCAKCGDTACDPSEEEIVPCTGCAAANHMEGKYFVPRMINGKAGMVQVDSAPAYMWVEAEPAPSLPAAGSAGVSDAIEQARRHLSNAIEDAEDGKTAAALPALREAAHFLASAAVYAQQAVPELHQSVQELKDFRGEK